MENPMSQLGPYELRGELGRGAMAVVWRAWDPMLEREIAIKEPLLRPDLLPDVRQEFVDRFQGECRTAARLNHPNIITVYDAGLFDGRPAVIMELVQGETLAQVLARGPFSLTQALTLEVQLLHALGYAHSSGVVHRDVKPDNVFVTSDGRIKLADFGIACLQGGNSYTQAGTVLGSPGYMAPEQIRGIPADQRADIFSAGVVLYEMLAGVNPFEAGNPLATMDNAMNNPIPSLGLGGTAVDVDAVIARATAKEPAQRFASAEEMILALGVGQLAENGAGPSKRFGAPVLIGLGAAAVVGVVAVAVAGLGSGAPGVAPTGVQTASTGVVSANPLAASGSTPQNQPASGVGAAAPEEPSPAEQYADLESELGQALKLVFDSSDNYSSAYEIRDLQLAQDDSGMWWGIGTKYNLEYGNPECYGLMCNDTGSWRSYAIAYSDYGVYFEGGDEAGIPAEVKAVLLADIQ